MRFEVLGSDSKGNCYLLKDRQGKILILECGVNFDRVMKAINYDVSNVVGVLITHSHIDHAKYVVHARKYGLKIFALKETIDAFKDSPLFYNPIKPHEEFVLGGFKIKPFELLHNVPIVGYFFHHKECGNTIFVTDTTYIPYTFPDLNNIIIEANYLPAKLNQNLGGSKEFLRNRIVEDHMSFETTMLTLKKNDLSKVNNIVLVHLSVNNADEELFVKSVIQNTGKKVTVAKRGLVIDPFDIRPF